MGLFRPSKRTIEAAWSQVPVQVGDRRIDYAHLRVQIPDGPDDLATFFLTENWLMLAGPGRPLAAWELGTKVVALDNDPTSTIKPAIIVKVLLPNPEDRSELMLFPMHLAAQRANSAANRVLARDFFQALANQLERKLTEPGL